MKVVTFGEIMLRLSPPVGHRFSNATMFECRFGGAEANVAISLAQWGLESLYVTRLPATELGEAALMELRRFGVDVSHVTRGGSRIGVYYLEHGAAQRPSKVIYDRSHSAFAEFPPESVDWVTILSKGCWFHVTGITPALGVNLAQATREGVIMAEDIGLPVSLDLNYRRQLWTPEQAALVLGGFLKHVSLLITNEEDARTLFGIAPDERDAATGGAVDPEAYRSVAIRLKERFPFVERVAITLRGSLSASDNTWTAVLWDGKEFTTGSTYSVHVVDRVGTGDAFAAGLIYGLVTGMRDAEALNYAIAASCLKHSIVGDLNLSTRSEIETLTRGRGHGRIVR